MLGSPHLIALADAPTWMYEWDLGGGVRTRTQGPELQSVHDTRARTMEPAVRAALAAAGPGATAVDLACCEGWFAHRLLEWGASRVVGVDIRPENIERAEAIRDHYGIGPERLSFSVADVYDTGGLGAFDVVLCLGLIYHLENPVGGLRAARALTRRLCVVETQLHGHDEPILHGWGQTGEFRPQKGVWVVYDEEPHMQADNTISSRGGVLSFIPNRVGLFQAMEAAGFVDTVAPPVPPDGNPQYVEGHRLVVAARVPPATP